MNIEAGTFEQSLPEVIDGVLDCGSISVTCSFNRWGSLLAVGCNDGRIVIWDVLTRGIAQSINAHIRPICSLSWSRTGHKLLSASSDYTVSVWDVKSGNRDNNYWFPSLVLGVQFHPRDDNTFLVTLMKHAAVLIHLNKPHTTVPLDKDDEDVNICACFDKRGKHLLTGNGKGKITVFEVQTMIPVASFTVFTSGSCHVSVRSLEFSRRGNCFLVNGSDRIIRVYDIEKVIKCGTNGEPEPTQKLQDLVNKLTWKKCGFSGDGEYIYAGVSKQHSIYIWEKINGNLAKILEGSRAETLQDVEWHPIRPVAASTSSGVVSLWTQKVVENWSAFAPGFKELDENVEYEERESEFDIEDEDKDPPEEKVNSEEEDVEVDVMTVDTSSTLLSSDEEETDDQLLIVIPISTEIDDFEDAWNVEDENYRKIKYEGSVESTPKKTKQDTIYVELPNALTTDGVQPLLDSKSSPSDRTKNHKFVSGKPSTLRRS